MIEINFKEWKFQVDKEANKTAYSNFKFSGSESCTCKDCKNYLAYRDQIFPESIKELFLNLGIDYKKEVEITYWEELENGFYYIGGWFHFRGKMLEGKSCNEPLPQGNGSVLSLEKIDKNFSIGFCEGNTLTFFEDKTALIQVEFSTNIPWVI